MALSRIAVISMEVLRYRVERSPVWQIPHARLMAFVSMRCACVKMNFMVLCANYQHATQRFHGSTYLGILATLNVLEWVFATNLKTVVSATDHTRYGKEIGASFLPATMTASKQPRGESLDDLETTISTVAKAHA